MAMERRNDIKSVMVKRNPDGEPWDLPVVSPDYIRHLSSRAPKARFMDDDPRFPADRKLGLPHIIDLDTFTIDTDIRSYRVVDAVATFLKHFNPELIPRFFGPSKEYYVEIAIRDHRLTSSSSDFIDETEDAEFFATWLIEKTWDGIRFFHGLARDKMSHLYEAETNPQGVFIPSTASDASNPFFCLEDDPDIQELFGSHLAKKLLVAAPFAHKDAPHFLYRVFISSHQVDPYNITKRMSYRVWERESRFREERDIWKSNFPSTMGAKMALDDIPGGINKFKTIQPWEGKHENVVLEEVKKDTRDRLERFFEEQPLNKGKKGVKTEKGNAPVTLGTHKVAFDYRGIQSPERSLADDARMQKTTFTVGVMDSLERSLADGAKAHLNAVLFDGDLEDVESVIADKARADSKKVAFEGMEGVDSGLAVLAMVAVEGVRAAENIIAPVANMERTGERMDMS